CMLAEEGHQVIAHWAAAETFQRLQNRHECFAGPVLFDTLAAGDSEHTTRGDALPEFLDERRLPDSGIAAHENDLTLAGQGALQVTIEALELRVPTHDRATESRAPLGWLPITADARDETISATMNGRDEARRSRAVTQDLAQLADADRKDNIAHRDTRPDRCQELFPGH